MIFSFEIIPGFLFWENRPFGILVFTLLNVDTICNENVIYKKPLIHTYVIPINNNMP